MDGNDKKGQCNCWIKSHTIVAIVYNAMNVQRYYLFICLFYIIIGIVSFNCVKILINQKTTNPKAKHHPKNHNLSGKIPNCLLNGFTSKIGTLLMKYQVNLFYTFDMFLLH